MGLGKKYQKVKKRNQSRIRLGGLRRNPIPNSRGEKRVVCYVLGSQPSVEGRPERGESILAA